MGRKYILRGSTLLTGIHTGLSKDDNGITVPDWGPSGVVFSTHFTETLSACASLSVVSRVPTLPFIGFRSGPAHGRRVVIHSNSSNIKSKVVFRKRLLPHTYPLLFSKRLVSLTIRYEMES